jgi:hypothetical protein
MLFFLPIQEAAMRRITVWSQPWKISLWDPISKIPNIKTAGRVTQMSEHQPSKCEALSSNSITAKKTPQNKPFLSKLLSYFMHLILISLFLPLVTQSPSQFFLCLLHQIFEYLMCVRISKWTKKICFSQSIYSAGWETIHKQVNN